MNKTTVKFKKLDERAQIPHYGTEFAAGADLYACLDAPLTIAKGATEFVHTGIAMEIPTGLVGLVYARSGLACKKGLAPANKVGVVDSDYRGEIMVALHNHSNEDITIESGERVAHWSLRFLPVTRWPIWPGKKAGKHCRIWTYPCCVRITLCSPPVTP